VISKQTYYDDARLEFVIRAYIFKGSLLISYTTRGLHVLCLIVISKRSTNKIVIKPVILCNDTHINVKNFSITVR
jgi:hypothetical protein